MARVLAVIFVVGGLAASASASDGWTKVGSSRSTYIALISQTVKGAVAVRVLVRAPTTTKVEGNVSCYSFAGGLGIRAFHFRLASGRYHGLPVPIRGSCTFIVSATGRVHDVVKLTLYVRH